MAGGGGVCQGARMTMMWNEYAAADSLSGVCAVLSKVKADVRFLASRVPTSSSTTGAMRSESSSKANPART